MSMQPCPHCGGPGLTNTRKLVLPPGMSVACPCCGKRIGVSLFSVLAAIPLVVALLALRIVQGDAARMLALIVGVAATAYIQWRYVPLVPR